MFVLPGDDGTFPVRRHSVPPAGLLPPAENVETNWPDPRPQLPLRVPMHQPTAVDPVSPRSAPGSAETDLPSATAEFAAHLTGPSCACTLRPDFLRTPQPQLVPAFGHQPLESGIVPTGLHSHSHRLPLQQSLELLRLFASPEAFFLVLPHSGC